MDRRGTYSRIKKINKKYQEENTNIYEVIRKGGIHYLPEDELKSILGVIRETLSESFKEGYEAQDILLYEGEKPEIRVKGQWQVLEECKRWELNHFNYFLFNMAQLSTKNRNGRYHIGEETVKNKKGQLVGTPKIEYTEDKVNIRSKRSINRYGNRFLDTLFFMELMKERGGSYDFSLSMGEHILRCHVFSGYGTGERQESVGLTIRVIPKRIPKTHELNLPNKLEEITNKDGGLFLVSGRTGDGKSTTVASIINKFNHDQRKRRVITVIEDPIEFVHKSQNAKIIQRRIGDNVPSYERATDDSLRESSDIVVLGELRNKEEISNALRLAEVGKLVIATIHANSVADTVDRFIGEFSNEQEQYRRRMLENLLGILHQNLIVYRGEQFPLSSMIMLEDEEARRELRNGRFTRDYLSGLIEGNDEKDWAVSQQDWFSEKEKRARNIQERIDNGELSEVDVSDHDKKLLNLLYGSAREVILGDNSIRSGTY